MITALVTGSAGFAGQYLLAELTKRKVRTAVFDLADGNDVRDYEQVRAAVEQVRPDWVFHLAAQAFVAEGSADPMRAFAVNCDGTVNVLEAVRRVGLLGTRVHVAGTSEEYGWHQRPMPITEATAAAPTTIYGASKACGSIAALAYGEHHGMPVVVTRASNHTGPGQSPAYAVSSFARRLVMMQAGQLSVLEHGDLSGWRDFLDVRDVVRAYVLAVCAEPGVYNVASGRPRTMRSILDDLCEVSGMSSVAMKENESAHRRQRSIHFRMSTDKIGKLGWGAGIPWRTTLADLLEYWRGRVG